MTAELSPTIEFLARLKKIDSAELKVRDILVLWAIAREHGMMGQEIAFKLGYASRSHVQLCFERLIRKGFVEDRRLKHDQQTPNELFILPAGDAFLAEVVPT